MLSDLFLNKYNELVQKIELTIGKLFPDSGSALDNAMRYSVTAGGKRIRPVLVLASGKMLSVPEETLLPVALAFECIHTASLIHDDLPALDGDELRRGKPTCHRVFGEGVALLAGDALISESFRFIAECEHVDATARVEAIELLARAITDLCLGQVMDLSREEDGNEEATLRTRHLKKTGALLSACCVAPLCFSERKEENGLRETLAQFGEQLGLLFQVIDDILDVSESSENLGKNAHGDERRGTPTYVSIYGLKRAQEIALQLKGEALDTIAPFGEGAWFLRELVTFVAERRK